MSSRASTLVVVGLLLLAGCAGFGGSGAGVGSGADGGSQMAAGDGAGPDSAAASVKDGDGADKSGSVQVSAAVTQRAIVRTGRMVVEVENFSDSNDAIAASVRERGGYVSDSARQLHRDGDAVWYTGYIVLRIPSEDYQSTQDIVSRQGTVRSEETSTDDVTDQLVDLEARLENLRGRRDRLRTFYERANSTSELLRIEEELSTVQSDIERLEAKKRSLEQRVAYSTLRVELREPSPEPAEIRTQYHEQSLVAVFLASTHDVYVFGRASLVTLAGIAPWLAVLAVPVVGGHRALRGRIVPWIRRAGGDNATESDDDRDDSSATESDEQRDSSSGPGDGNQ